MDNLSKNQQEKLVGLKNSYAVSDDTIMAHGIDALDKKLGGNDSLLLKNKVSVRVLLSKDQIDKLYTALFESQENTTMNDVLTWVISKGIEELDKKIAN